MSIRGEIEQLPPSEYDAPIDLRKSTLDWDDVQRRLPRLEAQLAEIRRLFARCYPDEIGGA